MSGIYPSPPDPLSPKRAKRGEGGRKRTEITQIHWDFESGVLRIVGKDEGQMVVSCFVSQGVTLGNVVADRTKHFCFGFSDRGCVVAEQSVTRFVQTLVNLGFRERNPTQHGH